MIAKEECDLPTLNIPDELYTALAAQAERCHVSVEELVLPILDRAKKQPAQMPESFVPLSNEEWLAEMEEWKREIESHADRYPPWFVLDDSRETMYFGPREAEH